MPPEINMLPFHIVQLSVEPEILYQYSVFLGREMDFAVTFHNCIDKWVCLFQRGDFILYLLVFFIATPQVNNNIAVDFGKSVLKALG